MITIHTSLGRCWDSAPDLRNIFLSMPTRLNKKGFPIPGEEYRSKCLLSMCRDVFLTEVGRAFFTGEKYVTCVLLLERGIYDAADIELQCKKAINGPWGSSITPYHSYTLSEVQIKTPAKVHTSQGLIFTLSKSDNLTPAAIWHITQFMRSRLTGCSKIDEEDSSHGGDPIYSRVISRLFRPLIPLPPAPTWLTVPTEFEDIDYLEVHSPQGYISRTHSTRARLWVLMKQKTPDMYDVTHSLGVVRKWLGSMYALYPNAGFPSVGLPGNGYQDLGTTLVEIIAIYENLCRNYKLHPVTLSYIK